MNRKLDAFQQFLTTQSTQIPIFSFVYNLLLAALLGYILYHAYVHYGKSLSNRRSLGAVFILMTMTTMLIISIVKSSLALSLGLVGALSIVRFRAAIKEPEELAFLFLTIAIGLGLGADQTIITLIGFFLILIIIGLRGRAMGNKDNQNLFLTISSCNPEKVNLSQIVETLKNYCRSVNMRRIDENKEMLEVAFLVEFDSFEQFEKAKNSLQSLSESIHINFLDNKGIE
jgi:uncharacterized membrane protein YhiD involved in acid resistance